MKLIKELEILKSYPVFTLNTVKDVLKKDRPYARTYLNRLKKRGLIFSIEKNKYTCYKDPFLIASRIIWPSYISGWSALSYYHLTEQIPHAFWIITTKKKKSLTFERAKIIFIKTQPKFFFGFDKINYQNFEVFLADPEKTLIDCALFRKVSFSEIIEIFKKNLKALQIKKFIRHLLRIRNKSLIKRFGFLLDRLGQDYSKQFKSYLDPTYIFLDYSLPKKGKRNKKWRIIINTKC